MDRICLNRLLLITATRNSTGPYLEGEDDGVSTAAFTNKSSGLTERTVLHMAQTLSDHSPRIVKPWKLFGRASSAFLSSTLTILTVIFSITLFRFWTITCEQIRIWFCSSVGDPWHIGADPDPYFWLMYPDPDPDPTPDQIPFFSEFKHAKNVFFHIFFL
jgi:hypothetical protein